MFTAEGDMRQALNNLQSTHAGYGFVNRENVFKVRFLLLRHLTHHRTDTVMLTRDFFIAQVCDQPHPLLIKSIISECEAGELDKALQQLSSLWGLGYSAVDIIGTMFRVLKTMSIQEYLKLEFIRVSSTSSVSSSSSPPPSLS